MPGSGVPLLWNENAPAETDIADAAPIRSLETSLRNGLAVEHNWPNASAPNFGYHLLGSCRPFYDIQSNVSSAGTDGRLMVTSDTSRLFHVGSAGTMLLGGSGVLSVGSAPLGGQRGYWAHEVGDGTIASNQTSTTITFPNSGFSSIPWVVASPVGVETSAVALSTSATATVMTVYRISKNANTLQFQWYATGPRTL